MTSASSMHEAGHPKLIPWDNPKGYYLAVKKKNTFESVLMSWMKLEPIIQSEVSQKEKDKYCILMHVYGLERWYRRFYMRGSKEDTDVKNKLLNSMG